MRTIWTILLSLLAFALPLRAAEVQRIPVTVADRPLVLIPELPQLLNEAGDRMPRSMIWSDSKAAAFHLSPAAVVKFYTGPRYQQDAPWQKPSQEVVQYAQNETDLLREWAKQGLAAPVIDAGTTPEGIPYAVLQKVRGASGAYVVKKGRFAEVSDKVVRLAQSLMENGWELGTFNPTQFYVDRRGGRALLIKAYSYDRRDAQKSTVDLASHYDGRLGVFHELSSLYPAMKAGQTLSTGEKTSNQAAIWRMALEAIRTGKSLRIVYRGSAREQARVFHALPLPSSLKNNDFMKGYIKTLLFPENGRAGKEYTFRLDRIAEAQIISAEPEPAPGA